MDVPCVMCRATNAKLLRVKGLEENWSWVRVQQRFPVRMLDVHSLSGEDCSPCRKLGFARGIR